MKKAIVISMILFLTISSQWAMAAQCVAEASECGDVAIATYNPANGETCEINEAGMGAIVRVYDAQGNLIQQQFVRCPRPEVTPC